MAHFVILFLKIIFEKMGRSVDDFFEKQIFRVGRGPETDYILDMAIDIIVFKQVAYIQFV